MKVAFISNTDLQRSVNAGVRAKILGQVGALKSLGCKCDIYYREHNLYKLNNDVIFEIKDGMFYGLRAQFSLYYHLAKFLDEKTRLDIVYFRHTTFNNPFLLWLLYGLHSKGTRVIVEIPTYPYREEMRGFVKSLLYYFDGFHNKFLRFTTDRIVTFYGQNQIFGIKTVQINNGIAEDKIIKKTELSDRGRRNKVVITGVGNLSYFHGYDRILHGIAGASEATRDIIHFNIIGVGPELENLKNISQANNINRCVTFWGYRAGEDLKKILLKTDLGIGTLAMHRKNITTDSSLKTREYFAHGLPVLLAAEDNDLPVGTLGVKYVAPDDSPVEIEELLKFVHQVTVENRAEILRYASDNLTWVAKMRTVLEAI
jgi:glycosyltransferase involved in cell wall biosynthesis